MANNPKDEAFIPDGVDDEVLKQKLMDAEVPGFEATFDPDEAEQLGVFEEDALSEEDAKESRIDLGRIDHEK